MQIAIILDNLETATEIINYSLLEKDNILYELRLDKDINLLKLVKDKRINPEKLILTLRSESEGGSFSDNKVRSNLLNEFLEYMPNYIDLEYKQDIELVEKIVNQDKSKLIISRHDYADTMENAAQKFLQEIENSGLLKLGNQIVVKFVGKPFDVLDTFNGINILKERLPRHIILGIGEAGVVSRTLVKQMNQELVFASTTGTQIIHYQELLPLDDNKSVITGLIGKTLKHSLSPKIQKILFEETSIPGYYHLLEITTEKRLELLIPYLIDYEFKGSNITFPYKTSILKYSDRISNDVQLVNAANTLIFSANRIQAENTDISGFSTFLKEHYLDKLSNAVILGAGGACRAVVAALLKDGIEVTIVNRSENRKDDFTKDLLDQVNFTSVKDLSPNFKSDLYVNATPIGFDGSEPTDIFPFPKGIIAAIDLVYSKGNTGLVSAAKRSGIEVYDGKEMLFHQAVDAFELWTRVNINRQKTRIKFEEIL